MVLPCKLSLAATSLAVFPFSSSCKASYFYQSNLDMLSLCSHCKKESYDAIKVNKNQQKQNRTSDINVNSLGEVSELGIIFQKNRERFQQSPRHLKLLSQFLKEIWLGLKSLHFSVSLAVVYKFTFSEKRGLTFLLKVRHIFKYY